jgi:hypothetical protein
MAEAEARATCIWAEAGVGKKAMAMQAKPAAAR